MSEEEGGAPPPKKREYNDKPNEMTKGRRVARFLSRFSWYNPQYEALEEQEQRGVIDGESIIPSLDDAWEYYEHFILPRFLTGGGDGEDDFEEEGGSEKESDQSSFVKNPREHSIVNTNDCMEMAAKGEDARPTKLYPVWSTPGSQLADFGVGVGIYFLTLKISAVICLIAGLINIPTILYFEGSNYSNRQEGISNGGLKGSAVCTDVEWKACPSCVRSDWDYFPSDPSRFASIPADIFTPSDSSLAFILVNNCTIADRYAGIASFCSLIFVTVSIFLLSRYLRKKEVDFDLQEQTATDYSIEVINPPVDANDPEVWKEYMEGILPDEVQNKHVTCCTVALDNTKLINHLSARRQLMLQLELMTPPEIPFDKHNIEELGHEIPLPPTWKRYLCFATDPRALIAKIRVHEENIEELSTQTFEVSSVFITYETEEAQRAALKTLDVSGWNVWRNTGVEERLLFRGDKVLSLKEPAEPSSIRYEDLDDTFAKTVTQLMLTTFISLVLIVGGAFLIFLARRRSAFASGITIKIINSLTPAVCSMLVNKFESHAYEGQKQTSEYVKVTIFRWVSTAIVNIIITPFTSTTKNGAVFLLSALRATFIFELVTTPVLQLLDIGGNVKRHILGPRAVDQRRMDLKFLGNSYTLGERYTDLTKILFLTFFYAVIFPTGFFYAFATLALTYWVDKYSLLRQWGPAPKVGSQISEISRDYFFNAALLAFAIFGAYQWAGFPYDDACVTTENVSELYAGTHTAINGDGDEVNITIAADSVHYEVCSQDMLRFFPPAFPALPVYQRDNEEWMLNEQELIVALFGWAGIGILVFTTFIFTKRIVVQNIKAAFFRTYEPQGEVGGPRFSQVREIFGYIPSVQLPGFPFPLLVCDLSGIQDLGLVGWKDTERPYSEHSLIYDVPRVAERLALEEGGKHDSATEDVLRIFSIVKEWPYEENEGDN